MEISGRDAAGNLFYQKKLFFDKKDLNLFYTNTDEQNASVLFDFLKNNIVKTASKISDFSTEIVALQQQLKENNFPVEQPMLLDISDIMKTVFAETFSYFGQVEWGKLIQRFVFAYQFQSEVLKLPEMFYEFVTTSIARKNLPQDFIFDLLKFELAKYDVAHLNKNDKDVKTTIIGDCMTEKVLVNQDFVIRHFEYNVHCVDHHKNPVYDGKCILLIFKNPTTQSVSFIEITLLQQMIFEQIAKGDRKLRDILIDVQKRYLYTDFHYLEKQTVDFFYQLMIQKAILGFVKLRVL